MADLPPGPLWLVERGIGETRAALVEQGAILEAVVERDGGGARAGAVLPGRLIRTIVPRRRGIARLEDGEEILVEPIPPGVAEGAEVRILIHRAALAEVGLDGVRAKRALGRVVPPETPLSPGLSLEERLAAGEVPVRPCAAHEPDWLMDCGWGELTEEAISGEVVREEASLRLYPTPAMTLIDVDGTAPPDRLGPDGAALAARAIRRMGIGGSIGVDLPTMAGKADRLAAAERIDAALPLPFERTAVNGFGFVQIVRRRERASLMELLRADPVETAMLAALRLAERHGGGMGAATLTLDPTTATRLAARPDLVTQLEHRRGGAVAVVADATLSAGGCHVR